MLGPLIIDLEGTQLTVEEIDLIQHPWVGGIIFFARNYSSVPQLQDLISELRSYRPELLFTVDQEGGRVQRFREGFTRLPPLADFGKQYDKDPKQACVGCRASGTLMAKELKAQGITMSFAPVLDLGLGKSSVIGDRAFHADPAIVSVLGMAYSEGMRNAGMVAIAKHFPGHGSVIPDSHFELPIDNRTFAELKEDLAPFIHFIQNGGQALMMAHIVYPKVDELPVGFSRIWLQDILRGQLRFKGVIISDDLSMKGAAGIGSLTKRAELGLEAGCDLILLCNDRTGVREVLQAFETKKLFKNDRLELLCPSTEVLQ